MSIIRLAARNMSSQALSFVSTLADRLILVALLIRSWGPNLYSDWLTLFATASLIGVTEFGFQTYLGNLLTRAEARGRPRAFQRFVGLGITFYGVLGLVVTAAAVTALFLADFSSALNLTTMAEPAVVFLILAIYWVARFIRAAVTQIFRGKGETHRLIRSDPRSTLTAVLLSALAVAFGSGPVVVALIFLACELAFGIGWSVWEVRRRHPKVALRPAVPSRLEVRAAGSNLRWYGWLMLSNQVMSHVPILVIAWLGLTGPMLISFAVQRTLINVSKQLSQAVSIALGVEVARVREERNADHYQKGIYVLARVNTAFVALAAAGLLCFGPNILALWTGRGDLFSLPILLWLLLPLVVIAPAIPMQMLTMFGSVPKPQAISSAAQIIVGIGLAVIFGHIFGVVGVASGVAIGEIVSTGLLLPLLSRRALSISYGRLLRDSALFFIAALAWAMLVGLVVMQFTPRSAVSLIGVISVWGLVAAPPILLMSLPKDVRTILRGHWGRFRWRRPRGAV
jgi:O-antigen/teichoic acid export membrane protein